MEDYANLEDYQVYACGSPVMVEAAHQAFTTQRKLPSGQSGVIQIFTSTSRRRRG